MEYAHFLMSLVCFILATHAISVGEVELGGWILSTGVYAMGAAGAVHERKSRV
jgi:hypothetical protein